MDKINNLILMLTSIQAGILNNARAYDDDLEETWQQLKDDWRTTRAAVDKYLEEEDDL
jgi:hypothetical protein